MKTWHSRRSALPWLRLVLFSLVLASFGDRAGSAAAQQGGGQPAGEAGPSEPRGCRGAVPDLYFVDAHSQMDHRVDEARVLSLMDHGGVYRTLLSPHLQRSWQSVVGFAAQAGERIVPMVRTKGGQRAGDVGAYREQLLEQVNSGQPRGMEEVLVWHGGEPERNIPELRFDLDSVWVTTPLEIVRAHGWPFIVHIEFASLDAGARIAYLQALEALARRYPALPFLMIHMGQLDAAEVGRLIAAHPNLYFMTSHSNPVAIEAIRSKTWQNLFRDNALAPEWEELMVEHPDRFVFALDNVFSGFWVPRRYLAQMTLWWCGLGRLSPAVAHAIAHGNAERLWKLAPKPAGVRALSPWQAREQLGPVVGTAEAGPDTGGPGRRLEGGSRPGRGRMVP